MSEDQWDETAEAETDDMSKIRALLDGEALDMDAECKKRRCSNCFYSVLKRVEKSNGDDVYELKCFYSPGQIGDIAPDFFCGFWMQAGPKTLKHREQFEISVPAWAQYFDNRKEF